MPIRYRITIVYAVIVAIVLSLFSVSVYYYAYNSKQKSFQEELTNQAISTCVLLRINELDAQKVKEVCSASFFGEEQRSIAIYDYTYRRIFSYNDKGVSSLAVSQDILKKASAEKPYIFEDNGRLAIAVRHLTSTGNYTIVAAAVDKGAQEWLSNLRWMLIAGFLICMLIVAIAGYFYSLSLVNSISRFTENIERISSEKFSLRLDTGTDKDELQKLAITINDLLDRLQASFDTQRRFIDNASHELSTPLASISSQLDVTLQRDRTAEEYIKSMLSISDDVKRLSLLVRSLLEIAKVSGSMGGTELTSLRVDELIMRLPADMKKASPFYDVKIQFDEFPDDETFFVIFGNEHLLYSAFRNIVHNACKFAENKSAIVKLSFSETHVTISILDTGPGIKPNDLKHIFQPFYRSKTHDTYISGAGLGLALANRIIKLHKGSIEVKSEEGEGTSFVITLPLDKLDRDKDLLNR
ncbi:MAG: HAMP domain-containing sensor histidine kinase [Flavipsychrobacter sp.]